MRDPSSVVKLVALYLAWLLAAAAIGVLVGVFVGEMAALVGLVVRNGDGHRRLVDVGSLGSFLTMAALPFLLRERMRRELEGD